MMLRIPMTPCRWPGCDHRDVSESDCAAARSAWRQTPADTISITPPAPNSRGDRLYRSGTDLYAQGNVPPGFAAPHLAAPVVSPTHCRAEPEGDISILRFWKSNDQPVEIPRNLNLAGKTRIGSRIERDRQHFLLHRRGLTDGLDPTRIDIDVASRTGARTAALREDAPDTIVQRRIHQCPTEVRIDRFFRAIGLDERHPDGNY